MRIAEAVGKCQDVGSRIVPNRVVLIGKEYWDFGDRGPLALADAGCQVASSCSTERMQKGQRRNSPSGSQ